MLGTTPSRAKDRVALCRIVFAGMGLEGSQSCLAWFILLDLTSFFLHTEDCPFDWALAFPVRFNQNPVIESYWIYMDLPKKQALLHTYLEGRGA